MNARTECKQCKGTGKAQQQIGEEYHEVECPVCTHVCTTCDGGGEKCIDCPDCKGRGEVASQCTICNSIGEETGFYACDNCDCYGVVYTDCKACGGYGEKWIHCRDCNGTGGFYCETCDNDGGCPDCNLAPTQELQESAHEWCTGQPDGSALLDEMLDGVLDPTDRMLLRGGLPGVTAYVQVDDPPMEAAGYAMLTGKW